MDRIHDTTFKPVLSWVFFKIQIIYRLLKAI